ncbi:patatin-like phospholipase [Chloropicon primus]|uniref:Patatin n=1 Tax=Chloropicon primus TaxID=1764295 RepID=A0A5B8MX70_9CHLO|nr:patatin-like phospholipase [Chloropicon primus]UPR04130.1 patatin-like phospholipase [Chloropicon primus]|eukprot:QDZ24921.1 patatin-like phospholipase [Chloropicon primus]
MRRHSSSSAQEAPPSPSPSPSRPIVSFPGGGIYFWWNAGVLEYLGERYDLKGTNLLGASAGALAIALVACGIDFRHSAKVAYRLAEENKIYERPLALVGVWGRLVREWLEELLPEDAHKLCESRVGICVLEVLPLKRTRVSSFRSRSDLIEALMASVHIPFLLDYKPFSSFRGRLCIDGSALKNNYVSKSETGRRPLYRLITNPTNSDQEEREDLVYFKDRYSEGVIGETMGLPDVPKQQDIYLTYMKDEALQDDFFDFMQLKSFDGVTKLMDLGYEYARREDERGGFEALAGLRLECT